MIELSRRKFLARTAAFIAAPAIVRVGSLMPVHTIIGGSGGIVQYSLDQIIQETINHPLSQHSGFARAVWPGIRKWWEAEFAKSPPTRFDVELFRMDVERWAPELLS